jgi:hypothetical protein
MKLTTDRSRLPTIIDEHNWLYTDKERSLLVVHETRDRHGIHIQTDQFTIPLKILEKILKVKT